MKRIPLYKFYKHKYGEELLVDIVDYRDIRASMRRTPVFTETFHSITLVQEGDERVEVNGQVCRVSRGTVICSVPGEVWRFHDDTAMEALNLVFEKDFLLTFFRDNHFLDQFPYLSASRSSAFLKLNEPLFVRLETLYREMQWEISARQQKDQHMLRAMLYETLILLLRAKTNAEEPPASRSAMPASHYVERFERLVDDHFTAEHGTEFYADQLCVTSNYLNKMVKRVLGISTKGYIQRRRVQEACRQLQYTTLSVQEIAEWLGYESSTYFVRSFRKITGKTPLEFRRTKEKSPEK